MKPARLSALKRLALAGMLVLATVLMAGGSINAQGPVVDSQARQPAIDSPAATLQRSGMICTTSPDATFTLTTRQGIIFMPDGNVIPMWGFSSGTAAFQHPSPVLCVNEGDAVTIIVHNTLPEPISLIFPGQDDVHANAALSQPQFDTNGNLISLAQMAPAGGGTMTYTFVASRPGTFLYQSGTDAQKQVNMGLFGAIVVRPTGTNPATGRPYYDPNPPAPLVPSCHAYNDPGTQYNCATENIMVLSDIDPMLHTAVEQGDDYDMSDFHIRYWLMNGRSFPDTISDNGATWLPTQPYGSLVYIHPKDTNQFLPDGTTPNPDYNPHPALVRYVSVLSEDAGHHPHGNHQRVIAQDGNLLTGAAGEDLSYEKFAVLIGPGQTWDMLFDWENVDQWHPVTNPIPVTIPQLQNLVVGQFYSGSPYLGNLDTLPVGTQPLNQCGEYYHIAHNHQLHKITAWGMVLSGHITFTRIDPPPSISTCPQ